MTPNLIGDLNLQCQKTLALKSRGFFWNSFLVFKLQSKLDIRYEIEHSTQIHPQKLSIGL